jgi:hypothetical protein
MTPRLGYRQAHALAFYAVVGEGHWHTFRRCAATDGIIASLLKRGLLLMKQGDLATITARGVEVAKALPVPQGDDDWSRETRRWLEQLQELVKP